MSARTRLLAQTAEQAVRLPYRIWGFGEGPALLGLLAAGQILERDDLIQRVKDLVAPTLHERGYPEEHLVAVDVLTCLGQHVPELRPSVTEAIDGFVNRLEGAPRPVSGLPPVHRSDLTGLDRLIWVDCMHTDGPGLALAGRPSARLLEENAAVLQTASGLFHHGYDVIAGRTSGVHWGRGQGWALWGLVGTLFHEPDARLARRLDGLLAALAEHERDGNWRTVIDDPTAPIENSVAALIAGGLVAGMEGGVVAGTWAGLADRALAAACTAASGGALPVSEATPVGQPNTYLTRRTGVYPWGQGPLLLALAAVEEWSPLRRRPYSGQGEHL